MTAPGRYCLATCYCGECDHYVPIRRHDEHDPEPLADVIHLPERKAPSASAWAAREEGSSWIDKL
jgi:hypothetical protein